MTTANIYLRFDGNCKEAFEFYQSVLGGSLNISGTFADIPPQEGMPPISDELKNRIMHTTLMINADTMLLGSDTFGGSDHCVGNNFSISIGADSREKADSLFDALSEGGKASMRMNDTFWGDYFGMLTDKFGIHWMVSFRPNT